MIVWGGDDEASYLAKGVDTILQAIPGLQLQ